METSAENLLSNEKEENYSEMMKQLISSHNAMGCNMSWKLNFLLSHFGFFFSKNFRAVSEEHGEKFHQHIFQTEKRYIWLSTAAVL